MAENKISGNKKVLGAFFVILACTLWGSIGLAVRKLTGVGLNTFEIILVRGVLGSLAIGIYMLIVNPKLFKFDIKDIWIFLGTGILNMLLNALCYFYCIQITDLAIAGALNTTGPMFALIFGCLIFKEKFTAKKGIAIGLTFIGCVLLCRLSGASKISVLGIVLGIGAGIGYSMYSVFSRFAINKNYNAFTITFYSLLFSSVGIAFFCNWDCLAVAATGNWSNWIWLALVGIGDGFLGYIFYTKGLKLVETGVAAILGSSELVVSTLIGVLVYKESFTFTIALGLLMIFAGIFVCSKIE